MKKLVVITQSVDEADDLLGFFVGWLREFAKYYQRVEVITLAKGEYSLPAHVRVHSLGKERGIPKFRQLFTFYYLLFTLTPKAAGVFCHMSPVFAVIAWPFARMYGAKLVLWYLHRSVTLKLRLALSMIDTLVTADKKSLAVESGKIVETGHGIDVQRFTVPDRRFDISNRPLRILSVGRLSRIKDFGTLISAAAILKEESRTVQVRIVGRPVMPSDHEYERELIGLVDELNLGDTISFVGFVPYRDMPAQYAWADIVVGGTPNGGLDKAILEGMAAGCVPLVANRAMIAHLDGFGGELVYAHGDEQDLSEHILAVRDVSAISRRMTGLVARDHHVGAVVKKIADWL